jgi:hypothetical protein
VRGLPVKLKDASYIHSFFEPLTKHGVHSVLLPFDASKHGSNQRDIDEALDRVFLFVLRIVFP